MSPHKEPSPKLPPEAEARLARDQKVIALMADSLGVTASDLWVTLQRHGVWIKHSDPL